MTMLNIDNLHANAGECQGLSAAGVVRGLVFAACLPLSACIPAGPKAWSGAPRVVGHVHDNGQPVVDAELRLVSDWRQVEQQPDKAHGVMTRTDAQGRFQLGPIGKRTHAAFIGPGGLGESITSWALQLRRDAAWHTLWAARDVGYAPREERLQAECDLAVEARDARIDGSARLHGHGLCRMQLVPH